MKFTVRDLSKMALFAALCYIGTMIHIPIAIGGVSKTMIHLGNIFCLLGALVIGPVMGGISASVGMGLFDLLNGWELSAPSTIVLKFFIALIAGYAFKKIKTKNLKVRVIAATSLGILFNIIFAPIVKVLISNYILGIPKDMSKIILAYSSAATFINAVIAVIISTILYLALKKTKAIDKVD